MMTAAAALACWQVSSAIWGSYWVPGPWQTVARLATDLVGGTLTSHALYTATAILLGFVIGAIPAVAMPLALRRCPLVAAVVDPFVVAGYGVPKLTLTPVFLQWFGIGMGSAVAVVATSTFFILYANVRAGLRSVDARLVRMARVSGAGERDIARHLILPAASPYALAGIRTAVPYAVGGAVVAELMTTNRGLGYVVEFNATNFDTPGVFAALAIVVGIVLAADRGLRALEGHLLPWRGAARIA